MSYSVGDQVNVIGGTYAGETAQVYSVAPKTVRLIMSGNSGPKGNIPFKNITHSASKLTATFQDEYFSGLAPFLRAQHEYFSGLANILIWSPRWLFFQPSLPARPPVPLGRLCFLWNIFNRWQSWGNLWNPWRKIWTNQFHWWKNLSLDTQWKSKSYWQYSFWEHFCHCWKWRAG